MNLKDALLECDYDINDVCGENAELSVMAEKTILQMEKRKKILLEAMESVEAAEDGKPISVKKNSFPIDGVAFLPFLNPSNMDSGERCEIHWDGYGLSVVYDGKRFMASASYLPESPTEHSEEIYAMPRGKHLVMREATKEESLHADESARKTIRELRTDLSEKELKEKFPNLF